MRNYTNTTKAVLDATKDVIKSLVNREIGEYCEFYGTVIEAVQDDFSANVKNDKVAADIIAWNNSFVAWRNFAITAVEKDVYCGPWNVNGDDANLDIINHPCNWLREAVGMLAFELLETSIYGKGIAQDSPIKALSRYLDDEDGLNGAENEHLRYDHVEALFERMTMEHWIEQGTLVETVASVL